MNNGFNCGTSSVYYIKRIKNTQYVMLLILISNMLCNVANLILMEKFFFCFRKHGRYILKCYILIGDLKERKTFQQNYTVAFDLRKLFYANYNT